MVAKRPLLRGILTLTTAGLLVRMIGMAYRVLLVRVTGSEVVGVFQMTFPVTAFVLRQCHSACRSRCRGLSAVTAKRDTARVRASFKISFSLVLLNAIIVSALLLLCAHLLSGRVLSDHRTHLAILMMPIALVFTCTSGVVRGYFHGHQHATPPAIAQVVEQVVRVGVTLCLFRRLTGATVESAAAIAMLAMGIGEAAGFVTLLTAKLRWVPADRAAASQPQATSSSEPSNMNLISELLAMSLPLTAVGFITTISHTVDAIVIPRRLMCADLTARRPPSCSAGCQVWPCRSFSSPACSSSQYRLCCFLKSPHQGRTAARPI